MSGLAIFCQWCDMTAAMGPSAWEGWLLINIALYLCTMQPSGKFAPAEEFAKEE